MINTTTTTTGGSTKKKKTHATVHDVPVGDQDGVVGLLPGGSDGTTGRSSNMPSNSQPDGQETLQLEWLATPTLHARLTPGEKVSIVVMQHVKNPGKGAGSPGCPRGGFPTWGSPMILKGLSEVSQDRPVLAAMLDRVSAEQRKVYFTAAQNHVPGSGELGAYFQTSMIAAINDGLENKKLGRLSLKELPDHWKEKIGRTSPLLIILGEGAYNHTGAFITFDLVPEDNHVTILPCPDEVEGKTATQPPALLEIPPPPTYPPSSWKSSSKLSKLATRRPLASWTLDLTTGELVPPKPGKLPSLRAPGRKRSTAHPSDSLAGYEGSRTTRPSKTRKWNVTSEEQKVLLSLRESARYKTEVSARAQQNQKGAQWGSDVDRVNKHLASFEATLRAKPRGNEELDAAAQLYRKAIDHLSQGPAGNIVGENIVRRIKTYIRTWMTEATKQDEARAAEELKEFRNNPKNWTPSSTPKKRQRTSASSPETSPSRMSGTAKAKLLNEASSALNKAISRNLPSVELHGAGDNFLLRLERILQLSVSSRDSSRAMLDHQHHKKIARASQRSTNEVRGAILFCVTTLLGTIGTESLGAATYLVNLRRLLILLRKSINQADDADQREDMSIFQARKP